MVTSILLGFPGGWEDIDLSVSFSQSSKFNSAEDSAWVDHLNNCFHHSMDDSKSDYLQLPSGLVNFESS